MYTAASDPTRESQQHSSEGKEARDPDPGVEARTDSGVLLWEIISFGIILFHRRNSITKDDVSDTSEFFDVQRQRKTSIDVLQEATIDDYRKIDGDTSPSEHWIGVT